MRCYKCNNTATIKSTDKEFCEGCFCEIIEKRVRKEIRQNQLFQKNDNILMIDDASYKSEVNKDLTRNIIKDPTITVDIRRFYNFELDKDYDKEKRYDKIIIPWTLDDEAINYLKSRFEDCKIKTLHSKKMIKPLIGITNEEAETFAKIKKLSYKKNDDVNDLQDMLDSLEKKYPGTKFSILKTIRAAR